MKPGARFSKVPKLYGPFSGVTIPLVSRQNGEDLIHQTSRLFFFLSNHVKRSAFQNKRFLVSQMAFRARKVIRAFEKRASDVAVTPHY